MSEVTLETIGNAAPFDETSTIFDALVEYGLNPIAACSTLIIERYGVAYKSVGEVAEFLAPKLFTTQAEAEEYLTRYKSARVVKLTARIEALA